MSDMEADEYGRDRSRSPPRRGSMDRSRSPPGYRGSRRGSGSRRGGSYRFRESGRDRGFEPEHVYENSVFIGNLAFEATWKDLKDYFRDAGEIVHADVLMTHSGRSKGMGTVEFADRDTAQRAIEMFNGSQLMGRDLYVREDQPPPSGRGERGDRGDRRDRGDRGDRGDRRDRDRMPINFKSAARLSAGAQVDNAGSVEVFVGNLPYATSNFEFQRLFKDCVGIKSAGIQADFRGRSKGYGLLTFNDKEDAERAIDEFNECEVGGRPIQVRYGRSLSSPRAERSSFRDAPRRPRNVSSKNTPFTEGVAGNGPPSDTLLAGNLPWETTQSDLFELFGSIATVQTAEVQYDDLDRPSGNAVVQFADEEGAAAALAQLDNYEYGNRELHLSYASRPSAEDDEMRDDSDRPAIPSGPASLQSSSARSAPVTAVAPVAAPFTDPVVEPVAAPVATLPADPVDQIEE